MKKTKLLLIIISTIVCSNAQAQTWGSTAIPTNTSGDCLVGNNLSVTGGVPISTYGHINGLTTNGALGLYANTYSNDGSAVEVYGTSFSGLEGQVHLTANGTGPTDGIIMQAYNSGTYSQLMKLTNDGNAFISKNLTVQGGMGASMYGHINGLTTSGALGMYANTYSNDGGAVEVYGNTYSGLEGQVHLTSNGIGSADAVVMQTYHSGIYQQLMKVTKDGNAFISNNLSVQGGVPASTYGHINGLTTNGALGVYANTFTNDGAAVEVYGDGFAGLEGQVHITSNGMGGTDGIVMQSYHSGIYQQLMKLTNDGNAYITHNLTVQGGVPASTYGHINGATTGGALGLYANTFSSDGGSVEVYGNGFAGLEGQVHITSNGSVGGDGAVFQYYNSGIYKRAMTVQNSGAVVISDGSISTPSAGIPGGYNLFVQHGILTEKLKVALSGDVTNWSDFVFSNDYELMPLNKVESFVKKNKHLPEIPSASEVVKDGIDVASMDAKLLQKIEELTLYVIQQQKQIEKQNNEIESLKKIMN